MIQSYAKAQYYAKETGTPSYPKDTRSAWRCAAAEATSSTSEEVAGLKMNDDGNFMLDGKNILLRHLYRKIFILGIYLRFFGIHTWRKIWFHYSIRMIRTRTGGRRKPTTQP